MKLTTSQITPQPADPETGRVLVPMGDGQHVVVDSEIPLDDLGETWQRTIDRFTDRVVEVRQAGECQVRLVR